MKISFASERPAGAFALAIPVWGDDTLSDRLGGFGEPSRSLAARAAEAQRFERELGTVGELYIAEGEGARRLLLVGLGGNHDEPGLFERVGGTLVGRLLSSGETRLVIDASGLDLDGEAAARIAFGAAARSWRYDVYRTKLGRKQKPTLEEVVIVGTGEGAETAWQRHFAVNEGLSFTRELVTEPANIIYPESFVERCRNRMKGLGIEIDVLDEAQMSELGMGALVGVGQGSERPPRLLVMRWNGGGAGKPVVLVGKGVTFDTGGISIKPAQGMEAMKWDMGGAGAVAGAMVSLATRKAKANVVGICALAENMPDGNAQRPGDVVTSLSGQTIEVINTDAEGRLVLCDAITWAQREFHPEVLVDLATLTGAMIISLGHEYGGLFSNDDILAARLNAAGQAVGDKLWRMPMGDPYDKLIESPIADMKNVGPREGGSITAAQFIQRFVDSGVKWAHLDIAGMVWSDKPGHLHDKGATGYGVALLDRFIADNHEGVIVDFYHLTASPLERVLPSICEKVVASGERLLVVAEAEQLARIDEQLWTYARDSFLPHGRERPESQPILLSEAPIAANGASQLALADGAWRDEALGFARTFYFFDNDHRDEARDAWRALKDKSEVECRYWKQNEQGRWVQGP